MVFNIDFKSDKTISFINPITPEKIKLIISDESNYFYKLYIIIQSTCKLKKLRLFIILRALNEHGQICWSKPEPDILQEGTFDFDFEIYFISQKKNNEIAQVLETVLEIDKIFITEIEHDEFENLITNFSLKYLETKEAIKQDLTEEAILEEEIKCPLSNMLQPINYPDIIFTNGIQDIKKKIFLPNDDFIKLIIYYKLNVIFSCYKDSSRENYLLYVMKEGFLFIAKGTAIGDYKNFEKYYNTQNRGFKNFYEYLEAIKMGVAK